jgi:Na+/H+ antiporter NhaD/arsenite permease-like protein
MGEEPFVLLRWIVLAVFFLTYAFVAARAQHRAKGVWIGVACLLLARLCLPGQDAGGVLRLRGVFLDAINWNVLGLLAGAMLIADLFANSRVPSVLASLATQHFGSTRMVMLAICGLAGLISIFMDNVTTVLIVAPVALAVARNAGISPVPLLVGIAISSNLQGAATLVGDPPSMLLAASFRMSFNDFFVYQHRPSLFFAMQIGAVAGGLVLYAVFRRAKSKPARMPAEEVTTWTPTALLFVMIVFLASASWIDPGFRWLAGSGTFCLGCLGLAWGIWKHRPSIWGLLTRYDLPTILFLAGVFVMAYAMQGFGWVDATARCIIGAVGGSRVGAFLTLVFASLVVSAFIDNVAYVAVMLPAAKAIADATGGTPFLYAAGLLIGACLGGNMTPIGAACCVVSVGTLRREGHHVSFWDFARIGIPFSIAATAAGSALVLLVWR